MLGSCSSQLVRRPLFWILFGITSCLASSLAIYYFPQAIPILNVEIEMTRPEALAQARSFVKHHQWGPEKFEQTAIFSVDKTAKTFIELEGGGKKKLNSIITSNTYQIYRWIVRHYQPYNPHEVYIYFTPAGELYGFEEQLPQDMPGASLSKQNAQQEAERIAQEQWHINFADFDLVESSDEKLPNGRIDHFFIYERKSKIIENGPLRLTLGLSGNKLTKLEHSIRIPDAFTRRYKQIRSFNETFAYIGMLAVLLLYLFGGCVIGLLYLLQQRAILWHQAFIISGILSIFSVLSTMNSFPYLWISYNTAIAPTSIYIQFFLSIIRTALVVFIGFGGIFAAAEGLSRLAFTDHPQLWSLWSKKNAASIQVLGRTILGYLYVPIDMLFLVAFYYFTSTYLGWWNPSSALVDPNILATYFPWISAISGAVNAGFMEECLFRAIPLSIAALIGKKIGRVNLWLVITLILQALIFGAAHANYPAQPFYARFIELLFPSFIFGIFFIRYGLLPAIIFHTIYDLFWFSLPLFLTSWQEIPIQKLLIIIGGFLPIIVIVAARFRYKKWTELSQSAYNKAWIPSKPTSQSSRQLKTTYIKYKPSFLLIFCIWAAAIALWGLTTTFHNYIPPLSGDKQLVINHSNDIWQSHGVDIKSPWKTLAITAYQPDMQNIFIWRNYKQYYSQLLGTYLPTAQWYIRYAQFNGNVIDNAEEYLTVLNPNNNLYYRQHTFPESWAGTSLTQKDARQKAYAILFEELGLTQQDVIEISAISKKLPARVDWEFIFQDPKTLPSTSNQEGQTRIKVGIAGDKFSICQGFIFVPEKWSRAYQDEQTYLSIFKTICYLGYQLLLLIGLMLVLWQWLFYSFNLRVFLIVLSLLCTKSIFHLSSFFEYIIFFFSTATPFAHQLFMSMSFTLLKSVIRNISLSLLLTGVIYHFLLQKQRIYKPAPFFTRPLLGLAIGMMSQALYSLVGILIKQSTPKNVDPSCASAYLPIITQISHWLNMYLDVIVISYLFFYILYLINQRWSYRPLIVCASIIMISFVIGSQALEQLSFWLTLSLILGSFYSIVFWYHVRFDRILISWIATGQFLLFITHEAILNSWIGIRSSALLTAIFILIITYIIDRLSFKNSLVAQT